MRHPDLIWFVVGFARIPCSHRAGRNSGESHYPKTTSPVVEEHGTRNLIVDSPLLSRVASEEANARLHDALMG